MKPYVKLRIRVDIDPVLAADMHPWHVQRLAQGVLVRSCYRGVRIRWCSDWDVGHCYASLGDALADLSTLADMYERLAEMASGLATPNGRRWHDLAGLLRVTGQVLAQHKDRLWPAEET